jgi:hypothetical protein
MGMSTHVAGFIPPDDRFASMKAIWDACCAAGVEVPDEVSEFFQHEAPDPAGVEVEKRALMALGAVREYHDQMKQGYEIVLANVPADVSVIRVWNSW